MVHWSAQGSESFSLRTHDVEDLKGNPILGRFYTEELQKTQYPDIYLLEKILERRGNKLKVKFLGFEKPQFINKIK